MRRLSATAVAVGILLLWLPGPARAGTVRSTGIVAELALAGQATAWLDFERKYWSLKVAPPDGPVATLQRSARDPVGCDVAEGLAASARWVAVVHQRGQVTPDNGCRVEGRAVLLGPHVGPLRVLEEARYSSGEGCTNVPEAVAMDRDRLAVARSGCNGPGEIWLYDLQAGGAARKVAAGRFGPGIALAGRYLAVQVTGSVFDRAAVLVFDTETGAEVLRVDLHEVVDTNGLGGFRIAVDAAARVVVTAGSSSTGGVGLYWASPQEPQLHRVPVRPCGQGFAFDGQGRVAICREETADLAVVDLAGRVHNVFANRGHGTSSGLAFDGLRLAWADSAGIHNERYPYKPTTPLGPVPLGGGRAPQLPVSPAHLPASAPELASNTKGSRALVAWSSGTSTEGVAIVGRRLNQRGRPVSAARKISAEPTGPREFGNVQPTIAAGRHDRWLVAWTGRAAGGAASTIRVRLVDSMSRPRGPERVVSAPADEQWSTTPSVISDGRGGFLLAWHEHGQRDGGLFVQRLDGQGHPIGSPHTVQSFPAGTTSAGGDLVATARGRSLLVWSWGPSYERRAIFAQLLDRRGREIGERKQLSAPAAPMADSPVAAHNRRTRRTLVGWRQGDLPFSGDTMTSVLDTAGRRVAGPARLSGLSAQERLAAAPRGRGFLIASVHTLPSGRDIFAVRTTSNGRRGSKPFRVSRMGPDRTRPRPDGLAEEGSLPSLTHLSRRRVIAAWSGADDGDRPTRAWVRVVR